ncbi:M28 family metallopeptidase [Salegentibacter sp. JZCK2]|uniref:M28 family metallopeptidase n=1 Tax=Salegentibacter tibetensis TaxID=2873600 RepID=UPI001CCE7C5A|nr:M28 family metallopeptidase [Salegentibacter tibetensis]MBZ9730487.1 M28 family metallopeptidase [Salegentibacter tibetensis]
MKKMLFVALTAVMVACGTQKNVENASPMEYAETITSSELRDNLTTFSSDEYEGRNTGEPGQKKAAEFIVNEYKKLGIKAPEGTDGYYQIIPTEYFDGKLNASENVLGFIEGSEKPEEILVITSHYDHVGVDDEGNIYNGADDGGSGPMAILEIAEAFMKAKKDGYTPKRSILFIHLTGEEKGLLGSKYYVENPVFPLENTVANLNMDMIGRIDKDHEGNDNYVYLIGSDKLSTDLHELSENVNSKFMNMELDYTYNDENDPNRFYYRSDHYNFAKNNIPVIFYFNGVHPDYHKPTDTAEKIEYEALMKRAQLVFLTAWEIANRDERLVVDKAEE